MRVLLMRPAIGGCDFAEIQIELEAFEVGLGGLRAASSASALSPATLSYSSRERLRW
jgi:hypothetical protein